MCRCRQPQRQASIIKVTSTHTPAPRISTPSQSTSTSPTLTTPSPTPPPLQPVSFSYMKSFRDSQSFTQKQKHTPHYFYYQDSYSSSSSPPHEAATITAEALVHASCSLPSLHHGTNTSSSMQEMRSNSPTSTLSRSLTIMSTVTPSMHNKQKTETVLEHCSCGLTFSVDHILPTSPPTEQIVVPDELFDAAEATYYETINEPPVVAQQVHQHHSHHHGHIHYHMNSQQQTHNALNQTEEIDEQEPSASIGHQHKHHQHFCQRSHNCQHIQEQSFVQ